MRVVNLYKTAFPRLARMHHDITIEDSEGGGHDVTIDVRRMTDAKARSTTDTYDVDAAELAGSLIRLPVGQALQLAEQVIETICVGRRVFEDHPVANDDGMGSYAINRLVEARRNLMATALDLAQHIGNVDEYLDRPGSRTDEYDYAAASYATNVANLVNSSIGSLLTVLGRLQMAAAEYDVERAKVAPPTEPTKTKGRKS